MVKAVITYIHWNVFNLIRGTFYDLHLLLLCMQLDVIRDMAFFFLTSYYPVYSSVKVKHMNFEF